MADFAFNRRAYFDYEILEKFEAGIMLLGFEVKAVKSGRINLLGSYVVFKNCEPYLLNADISPYQPLNTPKDYDSKRSRKLLLKKSEIKYLFGKKESAGLTLIPLRIYNKRNKIKVEIALARGKKQYEKREKIIKRETKRKIERAIKNY
ncbi:MAG: SsrA-binding protein SmpB [Candidatus Omnitrophota bacterium]